MQWNPVAAILKAGAIPAALMAAAALGAPAAQAQEADCAPASIAGHVKVVSLFRRMDLGIEFLVLSQANAIIQETSGVNQLLGEGEFYGAHMRLQKNTDKSEAELAAVAADARRARMQEHEAQSFEDLRKSAAAIVSNGYEIGRLLQEGKRQEAVQLYTESTLAEWKTAKGLSYTAISEGERRLFRLPVACR